MSEYQAAIINHLEVWTIWFFVAYVIKDYKSDVTIKKN